MIILNLSHFYSMVSSFKFSYRFKVIDPAGNRFLTGHMASQCVTVSGLGLPPCKGIALPSVSSSGPLRAVAKAAHRRPQRGYGEVRATPVPSYPIAPEMASDPQPAPTARGWRALPPHLSGEMGVAHESIHEPSFQLHDSFHVEHDLYLCPSDVEQQ